MNSGTLRTCQQCSSVLLSTPVDAWLVGGCLAVHVEPHTVSSVPAVEAAVTPRHIAAPVNELPRQPGLPQCCYRQSKCHDQSPASWCIDGWWTRRRPEPAVAACMAAGQGAHLGFAASYKGLG